MRTTCSSRAPHLRHQPPHNRKRKADDDSTPKNKKQKKEHYRTPAVAGKLPGVVNRNVDRKKEPAHVDEAVKQHANLVATRLIALQKGEPLESQQSIQWRIDDLLRDLAKEFVKK